ncbi:MAG: hypothetical protein AB1540_03670 [Bdellovibrionota bacterium]
MKEIDHADSIHQSLFVPIWDSIEALRVQLCLEHVEIARALYLSEQEYFEMRKRSIEPSGVALAHLANSLNVRFEDLLFGRIQALSCKFS